MSHWGCGFWGLWFRGSKTEPDASVECHPSKDEGWATVRVMWLVCTCEERRQCVAARVIRVGLPGGLVRAVGLISPACPPISLAAGEQFKVRAWLQASTIAYCSSGLRECSLFRLER
jgi:hypothetical protein